MIFILLFETFFIGRAQCEATAENAVPPRAFILGDTDCDRFTSILDVTAIQRFLAAFSLNSFDDVNADFDNNGLVNILDATCLQFYLLDIWKINITEYDSENEAVKNYMDDTTYSSDNDSFSAIDDYNKKTDYQKDRPSPAVIPIPQDGILSVYHLYGVTSVPVRAGEYPIDNLIPGTISKYILRDEEGSFICAGYIKINGRVRMINGGGETFNIRDIGGWKCDGGRLRYGMVYRGCELNGETYRISLDDSQIRMFRELLNIRDEIDLRSYQEVSGDDGEILTDDDITYSALGNDVAYSFYPVGMYSSVITMTGIIPKQAYIRLIRQVFQDTQNNAPCYLHCAAGADRTGTICYMLEAMCGVSESDMDKEYELTAFSKVKRNRKYSDWIAFKNKVRNLPGSSIRNKVIKYVMKLGITLDEINAFRQAFIDGDPGILTTKDIE